MERGLESVASIFMSSRSTVADLRVLLEARADPNVIAGPGDISPLRNVGAFASYSDRRPMRQLLFEYGARESAADYEIWKMHVAYERIEPAYLANFHRDDREG